MKNDWVYKAARLIRRGIRPKQKLDDELKDLISLYLSELDFRAFAQEVARGFELTIVDIAKNGVVIVPESIGSPFATRLTDYYAGVWKGENTKERRALLAIIQVAVIATFFPTSMELENEEMLNRSVRVEDVESVLLFLCENLNQTEEASNIDSFFRPAARMLLTMPSEVPAGRSASFNSRQGAITNVLEFLTKENLLYKRTPSEGQEQYFALPRYQKMLKYQAESRLLVFKDRLMESRGKQMEKKKKTEEPDNV